MPNKYYYFIIVHLVSIIRTGDAKTCIDLLHKTRNTLGIHPENKYVFTDQQLSHLKGWECIKRCASEVNLQKPHLITGTKIRKYIVTVTKVASLSKDDLGWVARYLDHDIRVHCEYYRLDD